MKKMETWYYNLLIRRLKWFYLYLAASSLAVLLTLIAVKVDGISLLLRIWQG